LSTGKKKITAFEWIQQNGVIIDNRLVISKDEWSSTIQNLDNLVPYYNILALNGNGEAANALGIFHLFGIHGINQNHEMAHDYFQRALQAQNPAAYGYFKSYYLLLFNNFYHKLVSKK